MNKPLTKQEAADFLGMTVTSVDRLRMAGKLPYRKFGNLVRFMPEDLESFIVNSMANGWTPQTRSRAR